MSVVRMHPSLMILPIPKPTFSPMRVRWWIKFGKLKLLIRIIIHSLRNAGDAAASTKLVCSGNSSAFETAPLNLGSEVFARSSSKKPAK